MNLELRKIFIKDVIFKDENKIENDILYVNADLLSEFIKEDKRIKDVSFDIARPGESVRILPVKDVIEPRAKLDGEIFSGLFKEQVEEAGKGITYVLSGCAIVTTGPIVGFQEGLIDMSGPGAKYSIFSKLINIVMDITKEDFVDPHEHEEVVRLAGIKAAQYVGKIGLSYKNYEVERYEWKSIGEKYAEYPELPKVAYVYNCMSQGLLHDTYFYGRDSKLMIPTMITPLEVMDGAIVSGNCVSPGSKTTTYHHLNNAVIKECMRRHGKEINFMGIVLNPLMVTLKEKYRNCMLTVRQVEMLGAEGVVISQEGFGNPTTDLMIVCQSFEKMDIKTVIITNEDAGIDGMSESLPDSVTDAVAIVSTGNSNATIMLPKMDKTIGRIKEIERLTGGNVDSIQDDGRLLVEIHGIMGSHNLQGNTQLSAMTI
ncbi:glycine/sarcosine/betaine reductase component B subunit [Sedimentibacter sp. MB31-C6]|uniref:glycine/sarcosine/betaine reductase component B subunit n=1 Tax=Sedimentibacter sp. MB31-C6 TaxID=3109366 RepID=UPI002DDD1034|nr:glycine/sarcosine/betaine reductase component B subunit [Sedimentibacter sp. MB36-C1]WSI02875.1 glycine/sarcosine/betaine reductase component B subunit [Sedimentibacter sp. MB36-C1]